MMADREPIPGQHGGYRPGAGGKKGVSVQRPTDGTNHYAVLAAAKAKREMYRATITRITHGVPTSQSPARTARRP